MDGEEHGGFSRRGLFGLLGRGVKGFKDSLDGKPEGGRDDRDEPIPYPVTDRLLRPYEENVEALADDGGAWVVDLSHQPLDAGRSLRVFGIDLPEALVLVRVHERHFAACSCECPVDGSDLVWSPDDDRLRCPACESLWRLDGASMQGPADSDLARYVVDPGETGVTIRPL